MVLMGVVARWREDEIGHPSERHLLQDVLHAIPNRGKPAFGQMVQVDGELGLGKEGHGGAACLGLAFFSPGEDDISSAQPGLALGEGEQGPTRPDLDVIRVGADHQHRQGPIRRQLEVQRKHDWVSAPLAGTPAGPFE